MCPFQIVLGSRRKALAEQRLDVVLPQQVDDFFVSQHGIGAGHLRQANDENDGEESLPQMRESCHRAKLWLRKAARGCLPTTIASRRSRLVPRSTAPLPICYQMSSTDTVIVCNYREMSDGCNALFADR